MLCFLCFVLNSSSSGDGRSRIEPVDVDLVDVVHLRLDAGLLPRPAEQPGVPGHRADPAGAVRLSRLAIEHS